MSDSDRMILAGPYSIGSDVWPGVSKLIEECGELLQVLGKIIALGGVGLDAHWDGAGDLRERLQDELGDVQGAIWFLKALNPQLDKNAIEERAMAKFQLFIVWQNDQAVSPVTEPE